jgi:hypothetical protein
VGEPVHIALEGDVVAMCDVPIHRLAPRAEEPEQATCEGCIDIYIEGWDAAQEERLDDPQRSWLRRIHLPSWQRHDWLMAATGAGLGLAIASGVYAFAGGEEDGPVTASVVDCSQTQLYQPEDSPSMLPARVAQIRFVNNGDEEETFSPQVDGMTLVGGDDRPATFTLAAHESKTISYPMNPERHGNSEGGCYALDVKAVR